MNTTQAAAALSEIKKFTKVFKAFEEAENAIAVLANLDLVQRELISKQETLTTEIANLEDTKTKWISAIKQAEEKYQQVVSQGETAAEVAGKQEIANAHLKATKIVQIATEKVEEQEKKVVSLQEQSAILAKQIKEQENTLVSLETKIQSAKSYLENLVK